MHGAYLIFVAIEKKGCKALEEVWVIHKGKAGACQHICVVAIHVLEGVDSVAHLIQLNFALQFLLQVFQELFGFLFHGGEKLFFVVAILHYLQVCCDQDAILGS